MTDLPTRRTALRLLGAAGGMALPLACVAPAAAQLLPQPFGALPAPGGPAADGLRFSRFVVDASALVTPVNATLADLVRHDLTGDLKTLFVDRTAAGGATLLVRITSLYLPAWAGGRAGGNGGDGPDNIEGVGIVTANGRVLSQTPVYTTLDPSYSGAWYQPNILEIRVSSICYQFAYWLKREMGL